ncbi:MAG: DUF177 domain-containing protein [Sphingomonadales bacterium]|nr:DUF177 domain-containing protein [Sphingomonadales bacterium]
MRKPVTITADADERAALARRFAIAAIDELAATVTLVVDDDVVTATGRLAAALVQRCVATDDPLPVALDEVFAVRFEPEPDHVAAADEEIELAADECDVMHYENARIDLGEAVAQTLLLSLDPYPRGPDAEDFLKAKGVKSEAEAKRDASPFGALAALRDTSDKA